MKRKTVLVLGLIAATSLAGVIALPAQASGEGGRGHESQTNRGNQGGHGGMGHGMNDHGMQGGQRGNQYSFGQHGMSGDQGVHDGGEMMNRQMMMRMHGQINGGNSMMGGGVMDGPMFGAFGGNGFGLINPEEMRADQKARLEEFDANGDGSLSLEEFEALHSAAIREQMVDRFQALDNDGDGQVTSEEMTGPVRNMGRFQNMQDQSGHDGQLRQGAMMGGSNDTDEENN